MTTGMFHRGFLLLCLLAASLIASTTIHARELPGGVSAACVDVVHDEQDQSPSPSDPEKGVAHHHGCHSASSCMPGESPAGPSFDPTARFFAPSLSTTLAGRHAGPDLRPPIA